MAGMNNGRIVTGGLAAGVVMNIIDFLVNGPWLGSRWEAQTAMLNSGLLERPASTAMIGWTLVDLLLGVATVWLYAAIHPRFGAGVKTAMYAGFATWFVGHLVFASYMFNAFYTWRLVAASSAGGLVAVLAGAYVGGMLYKEAAA